MSELPLFILVILSNMIAYQFGKVIAIGNMAGDLRNLEETWGKMKQDLRLMQDMVDTCHREHEQTPKEQA